MKVRYGRTRSGKVVEVEWNVEGHRRTVQSYTRFEEWPDRVDALSMFESLCIRGRRILTELDLEEQVGFETIAWHLEDEILEEVRKGYRFGRTLPISIERISHGRTLLFSWFREGW